METLLKEQFETLLKENIGSCTCDEAYKSRNLTAPDCAWCNEHEGMMDALQAAYNLGASSKWIKVTDSLPEETDRYLVLDDDGDAFIDVFNIHTKKFDGDNENCYTHWQNLPTPPQN